MPTQQTPKTKTQIGDQPALIQGKPVIQVLENLLPENLHRDLNKLLMSSSKWCWGHGSVIENRATDPYTQPFWYFELQDEPVVKSIWEAMGKRFNTNQFRINRVYANGHTFGQGGRVHVDDPRANAYTLLYFPMEKWENSWQGETMYFDSSLEDARLLHTQLPRPNLGMLFNSAIPHVGRPPSRHFSGLRITVAFKLELVKPPGQTANGP